MALDGYGHIKIAKFLNSNGILCRKEVQRRKKHHIDLCGDRGESVYHWSTSTIGKMVTSEIYIGNLVWNRTGSVSYKDHRQFSKPKKDWVIVPNTHEGIISKEDFDKVQEIIKTRNQKKKKPEKLTIYKYKIKCADCGRGMCKIEDTREGHISSNFYCRNYKTVTGKCTPHKIRTVDLDKMVIEAIIMQIKSVLNIDKTIKRIKESEKFNKDKTEIENKIERNNCNINKNKTQKKSAYENWKLGKISRAEFIEQSKIIDENIDFLNNEINSLEKELKICIQETKEDEYWIEHFRRNKKIKTLSKEVIDELIECIYVHEDSNITIKFKYQNEYEAVLNILKEKGAIN